MENGQKRNVICVLHDRALLACRLRYDHAAPRANRSVRIAIFRRRCITNLSFRNNSLAIITQRGAYSVFTQGNKDGAVNNSFPNPLSDFKIFSFNIHIKL